MFCLIEHLDIWILSPCLLGAFVLCSCSSWPAVPAWSLNAHFTARTQRGCKCDAVQPNFHHVTFSHPKSATHTHSHRLTQTHTHYVGTLLGCVGGEAVDGRVTQLGWQLSSGLGWALRHRLHVLMVLAGHTHPPTYTHTQSDVQQPCLILLLAADYTPTCWMGGEGLRMWGEERGGCWGNPCEHTYRHTQAWCQLAVKSGGWPLAVIKHQLGSGQPTGAPPCCPVHSSTSQLASSSTPPSSPPPPLCTLAESEIFSSHICGNKCSSHRKLWSFSSSIISIFSHVNTEIYFHNDHIFALRRAHLCCLIMHKMETWTWGETQFQSDFLRFYSTQSFR